MAIFLYHVFHLCIYGTGDHIQRNQSDITEYILLGFGELPYLQTFMFLFCCIVYISTLIANFLAILLIVTDQHLHTPMYYFLVNLSCLEILSSSAILPKMLACLVTGDKSISFKGCITQCYVLNLLMGTECYLLSVMAYDRFLAICRPLHYATLMNGKFCIQLVCGSCINSIVFSSVYLPLELEGLHYCASREIDHFFCEAYAVGTLSWSCSRVLALVTLTVAFVFSIPPFLLTLISYVYIISAILRIPTTTGRQKAFSTCSSHLIVVSMFYGAIIIVYLIPKMETTKILNKIFALLYTVLPSIANPLIYSLRNKDVKDALRKFVWKIKQKHFQVRGTNPDPLFHVHVKELCG
nr:olfactory receptor 5AR1-like [Anolis sagrei ordinatus]